MTKREYIKFFAVWVASWIVVNIIVDVGNVVWGWWCSLG